MQSHYLYYALTTAAALTLSVSAAPAQNPVPSGLQACSAIKDHAARLDCFDKLAASQQSHVKAAPAAVKSTPVKPAPAKQSAQSTATIPTVPAAQKTPAQFGSELLPLPKSANSKSAAKDTGALDHISETVSAVKYSLHKKFIITLANGQVWRQLDSDDDHARFPHNAHITIVRGIVGGYNLSVGDSNKVFKVRRVK